MALKTVTKIKEYFSEEEIILDYNQQIEKRPEFKTFLENSKQVELKAFRKRIETEKFKEEKRRTSDPVHTDLTSWIEENKQLPLKKFVSVIHWQF